jgi:GT2 family glycosyltransferase
VSSPAEIDIVIVNFRCAADTLGALAVLGPWPHGAIWLVDNSADAAEAATLRAGTQGRNDVRLLVAEDNLGFGRGCNLAFELSRAPHLLLLNPDARIDAAHVVKLAEALAGNPVWGALSPKVFWDEERRFLLPEAFPQTPAALVAMALATHAPRLAHRAFRRYLQRTQDRMAGTRPFTATFLTGAVLMLRRDAVSRAGGLFDPDYFMFYEDTDLSLRLRRAGFRLGIAPQAEAVHEYRHKAFKTPLMMQARQVYFRKRFPRFFVATRKLARIDRLAKPVCWSDWGEVLPGPLGSAAELADRTAGAGIVALSPTPLMMPATMRPANALPAQLNDKDWDRLEAGRYMAAVAGTTGALRFVSFERAPG